MKKPLKGIIFGVVLTIIGMSMLYLGYSAGFEHGATVTTTEVFPVVLSNKAENMALLLLMEKDSKSKSDITELMDKWLRDDIDEYYKYKNLVPAYPDHYESYNHLEILYGRNLRNSARYIKKYTTEAEIIKSDSYSKLIQEYGE